MTSQHEPEPTTPSSATHTPALSTSYSLIVVMIVFVLFGAAGFFAAAQILV
jgi:hypothetical protein